MPCSTKPSQLSPLPSCKSEGYSSRPGFEECLSQSYHEGSEKEVAYGLFKI